MRRKGFCCYSLLLTVIVLTIFNIYLLRYLNIQSSSNARESEFQTPVTFSQLPSDSTGQYKVWKLFNRRTDIRKSPVTPVDITIVTQTSVWNLLDLIQMTQHWHGKISVAIFAPGRDIEIALDQIMVLRSCSFEVKQFVTFQIVMALSHPPMQSNLGYYMRKADSTPKVCGGFPDQQKHGFSKNYANKMVPYPVNLLRNVALSAAETSHVLVIDIDMIPIPKLLENFQKHFESIKREKAVYVLPTFELKDNHVIPETKKDLLNAWRLGNARPFYEQVCWKCQKYTEYERWKRSNSHDLSVAYHVEWHDPWEPFFIAKKDSVHYDERFKQYGFNRISQVCETHFSGYDFFVLDNAFLIHQGFKNKNLFHKSKDDENARNRILFRTFKKELRLKFPESMRHC